jgi:hypothetical protein
MDQGDAGALTDRTPRPQPRCQAETRCGTPCQSFASGGSPWCASHDPAQREAQQAARARGARTSNRLRALRGQRSRLDTPQSLVGFTARVIHNTLEQRLPYEVARVVLYGLSIQRQLVEVADLEQRMAAIEQRLGPKGGRATWPR